MVASHGGEGGSQRDRCALVRAGRGIWGAGTVRPKVRRAGCPVPAHKPAQPREKEHGPRLSFVSMIRAKADTHPPTRERRRARTHWGRSPPAAAETEVRPGFPDQRRGDSWQQPHTRRHTHKAPDHPPRPPLLPTPEPSAAEKTLLDLPPGAAGNSPAITNPRRSRSWKNTRLGTRHQTYPELAEQQAEHLQGGHGAVHPHVGHGPIRRRKHRGLHREREVKAGPGPAGTAQGLGHVLRSAEQQADGALGTPAPDLTHRPTYEPLFLSPCGEAGTAHVSLRRTPAEPPGQPLP